MARSASRRWLALVCAAALAGCDGPDVPRPTRGYVLISLDTLRADHLGCYGYERDTSPFLDRLAQRAALFENASVQYPSTLTSHMSIFTGLYPGEHGVYPPDSVLAPEIETLPEAFQRTGFRTAGFTEGGFVHGRFGFRRGFDVFLSHDRQGPDEVERTFERGRRFLASLADGERFFLFLHTYAVHAPYEPPESYRDLFWDGDPPPDAFDPTGPELSLRNALGETLAPPVRRYFEALYDAEIRRLDDVLRRFFAGLEELGLARDVTVIVTSDHGEEFQEHGRLNHTQLYREVLRVPLLVVHPDFDSPSRHAIPVESVDLAPTLYELAGLEPRGNLSGHSLVRYLSGAGAKAGGTLDEAYGEVAGGVRSLLRSYDGRLLHLLVFQPPPHRWWTRRLRLEVDADQPLAFEVRSFEDERTLAISSGGEALYSATIGPQWTPIELAPASGGGRRTLLLSTPDCTVADERAKPKKVRCFSFQVRGLSLARAELYDLTADPAESRDVGAERPDAVRSLYLRLGEYPSRDAAVTRADELDEDLRKELEALGYLQ